MFETKTDDMISLSQQMDSGQSLGALAVQESHTAAPLSSAVFAEPVVIAQPMQRQQRREISAFLQRMKTLAQMAGEDYRYSFPVNSKQGKKTIEGPTIKMANDLVREYGNCMVDVRVVEQGAFYIFYARFIDYETGFTMTRALRQRKGQATVKGDAERGEDIVFQIGQSKAIRNVIINSLQTYADFVYDEAKNSLVEAIGKALPVWRNRILNGCNQYKYDLARIELSVGRKLDEWLAVDIARVIAELKSVQDGMASFDDLYPAAQAEEDQPKPDNKGNAALKDALKTKENETAATTEKPEAEADKPAQTEQSALLPNDEDEAVRRFDKGRTLLADMEAAGNKDAADELLAAAGGQTFLARLTKDGKKDLVASIKKQAGIN